MDDKLHNMKKQHENIPIPDELNSIVKRAIKKRKQRRTAVQSIVGTAAASILLVTGINTSPAFASAVADVPVIGKLVKVITISGYGEGNDSSEAHIQTPAITGLDNDPLQESLNSKYAEENKKLYESFKTEVEELEKSGDAHMSLDSGYKVVTNNERLLTLSRYVVTTAGSSNETRTYDTIDKQENLVITLPSLFKDDSFIQVISENIKQQMVQQMKDDPNKIYWVEPSKVDPVTPFEHIAKDQSFYINEDGKLVISFNKYDVAPGYMGVAEFIIPTEVLSEVLVSHEYIK
ncbi:RsiV family protein [Paenibacillus sp. EC2-1]|uniref:RsiV family protein n=1 Tax=Paenibacillus sp. EC2-1 TaxID=3388665 RepID=UPI003BEEB4E7